MFLICHSRTFGFFSFGDFASGSDLPFEMARLQFTALLSLALSVHGWPQVRNVSKLFGEEITAANIISDVSARELPTVVESVSFGTLPVPRVSKRDAFGNLLDARGDDISLPNSLEDDVKRGLPVVETSSGLMTLPIIHVERPSLHKRGVEIRLENRSDVAYYAQRKSLFI